MLNLLSNSLKFTFDGGITIKVEEMSEDPNLFRITISDTGRGIEEKNKSKLFKQFCKLDLGTADSINPQGVGLGLVISNALAKLLG